MMYVWKELYYYFYIKKHKFQHIFENIFTFKQFLEILSKIITWKLFDNKFSKLCKLQRMNSFSSANIVPKAKGVQIHWGWVSLRYRKIQVLFNVLDMVYFWSQKHQYFNFFKLFYIFIRLSLRNKVSHHLNN